MKIIVGLGNVGKEYEKTRHNVGFMFLDYLKEIYDFGSAKSKCDSVIYEMNIKGEKVVVAKPQTYMNLSGIAVSKLKNWYKINDEDIIVIFDDIDIPFNDIRYREKGSGGTHNGMKNIVQMLNTEHIQRIKIGIGGIKHEKQNMADFVLQRFSNKELEELPFIFKEAETKLIEILDNKQK